MSEHDPGTRPTWPDPPSNPTEATVISSASIAPREQFDFWFSVCGINPRPTLIEAEPRDDFFGIFRSYGGSPLMVAEFQAASHRIIRTPSCVRKGSQDFVGIAVINAGKFLFTQNDRTVFALPGDIAVYFEDRPFQALHEHACDMQFTCIQSSFFPSFVVDQSPFVLSRQESPLAPLIANYIKAVYSSPATLAEAEDLVKEQLVSIVARALQAGKELISNKERLFEKLQRTIISEIANPDLSAKFLCYHLGVSRSTLFDAVASQGATLNSLIQNRRLEGCLRQMRNSQRSWTLKSICEEWGFRSQSNFNRVFRRRYGQTPLTMIEEDW